MALIKSIPYEYQRSTGKHAKPNPYDIVHLIPYSGKSGETPMLFKLYYLKIMLISCKLQLKHSLHSKSGHDIMKRRWTTYLVFKAYHLIIVTNFSGSLHFFWGSSSLSPSLFFFLCSHTLHIISISLSLSLKTWFALMEIWALAIFWNS